MMKVEKPVAFFLTRSNDNTPFATPDGTKYLEDLACRIEAKTKVPTFVLPVGVFPTAPGILSAEVGAGQGTDLNRTIELLNETLDRTTMEFQERILKQLEHVVAMLAESKREGAA